MQPSEARKLAKRIIKTLGGDEEKEAEIALMLIEAFHPVVTTYPIYVERAKSYTTPSWPYGPFYCRDDNTAIAPPDLTPRITCAVGGN